VFGGGGVVCCCFVRNAELGVGKKGDDGEGNIGTK
jgi:hypothetical protein